MGYNASMRLLVLEFLPEPVRQIAKYVIAGGIAAATQVGALAFFVEYFGVHYLRGVVYAFLVALAVAFMLQKCWTFERRTLAGAHREFLFYTIFALLSLGLNAGIMYILVESFAIWYLAAQVATIGFVAWVTFVLNRKFTFGSR